MRSEPIHFSDGAAYEDSMGQRSQLVDDSLLRWLDPSPGWRWFGRRLGQRRVHRDRSIKWMSTANEPKQRGGRSAASV